MIDFKGLDKTQLRYVERDCPDTTILNKICINKFIDTNSILNSIINDAIVEISELHPILKYAFNEDDDLLDKMRILIEHYKFGSRSIEEEVYISEFILNNFNTKQHRAWLADVFGEKVHEEDFMVNLRLTISKILYAILYV